MELTLPHNFTPRSYQLPLFEYMDSGGRRAVCIWHRRSGKDKCLMNLVAKKMLERVGYYAYFFPTYKQGKKVLWNGMDREGFKFTDHIPHELRRRTDNTEMLIELKNGSVFQVIGTDNVDSFRGANPVGAVFSEYAWQNPLAWDTIRPIMNENGGWAIFNTTPLGKNHAFRLYEAAKKQAKWFAQLLTVDDTKREDGSPVIKPEDIQEEREMGMEEDMILQEYWCSFEAAVKGSYYADQIAEMRDPKRLRICAVPYERHLEVHTAWDLGFDDATAIIFYQIAGKEIRIIDYEEHNGEDLSFYADLLDKKSYKYGMHYLPHDAEVTSRQTGKNDKETLAELGIYNTEIVPKANVQPGIQAVRRIFPRLWIDNSNDRMEGFIDRITQYRKEYDEERKIFRSIPEHDWCSHAADALRYLAAGFIEPIIDDRPLIRDTSAGRLGE